MNKYITRNNLKIFDANDEINFLKNKIELENLITFKINFF